MSGSSNPASLHRSPVARYVQLATLFRNRIVTGAWPVGTQIPTLEQLVEESGVARATVRQALGELEKDALIARRRAKGTFVLRQPRQGQWCTLQTDWAGMLRSRDGAEIELLHRADGVALQIPDLPIGTPGPAYTRLRRRHWFEGQAFLLTNVFIAGHLIAEIPPGRLVSQTAIQMVADLPGVALVDAHQVFTAGSADIEEADLLHVPLNAPVMKLDRFATGPDGRVLVASLGLYRADVVRLEIGLRRDGVTRKG